MENYKELAEIRNQSAQRIMNYVLNNEDSNKIIDELTANFEIDNNDETEYKNKFLITMQVLNEIHNDLANALDTDESTKITETLTLGGEERKVSFDRYEFLEDEMIKSVERINDILKLRKEDE